MKNASITQYNTQHSAASYKLSTHAKPTYALLVINKAFAYTYYTLQLAQHVFFQSITQYAQFFATGMMPLKIIVTTSSLLSVPVC